MQSMWRGRLAATLAVLVIGLALGLSPAKADYVVRDGNGAVQTMCSVVLSGVQSPCHRTPDGVLSGTLNAASAGASYQMTLGQGQASMVVYVSGLTASGATLTFKATVDGANYAAVNRPDPTGIPTSTIAADGLYTIPVHGKTAAGLFVTGAGSGTITLSSVSSVAFSGDVRMNAPLPPGTNTIGAVFAPQAVVTETSVSMTGLWVKVWTAAAAKRVVIGLPSDSGAAGDYSFNAALSGTSSSGGVPIAGGAGGSFDFAGVTPNSDLYVKATSGSKLTVQVFN